MIPLKIEEVFKRSGVPTHTFVKPTEYDKLFIALRARGRGLIVEGPSGIGKTTAVLAAIDEHGLRHKALTLSARKKDDVALIRALPDSTAVGLVIIDDFHKLDQETQQAIADRLKTIADEERDDSKYVIVGINRAGDSLIKFAPDLNNRIDTIRFETNPEERIIELVMKGEKALNITIGVKNEIVAAATGSFYLAQMLCFETCVAAHITQEQEIRRTIHISFPTIILEVMKDLSRRFMPIAMKFAAGPRLRPNGRAPYLHILKWLAEADDWSIVLSHELSKHPEHRTSAGQVVEKGYLREFLLSEPEFSRILDYQPTTAVLAIEDPQFVFFLRNIAWTDFARRVGYLNVQFERKYDFALSFAGEDRPVAKRLFELLAEQELSVFYDHNEQYRILAENVEDYLGPIYSSEATYVVCLLGPNYSKRIWTAFESDKFRSKFGKGVIPIWFTNVSRGIFDESTRVGGIEFDPGKDQEGQLSEIAELLRRKHADSHVHLRKITVS